MSESNDTQLTSISKARTRGILPETLVNLWLVERLQEIKEAVA